MGFATLHAAATLDSPNRTTMQTLLDRLLRDGLDVRIFDALLASLSGSQPAMPTAAAVVPAGAGALTVVATNSAGAAVGSSIVSDHVGGLGAGLEG